MLKHRDRILGLIVLLIDKAKSERGYSSAGRLIGRILHTLVGVYPVNSRFVNADEWASSGIKFSHYASASSYHYNTQTSRAITMSTGENYTKLEMYPLNGTVCVY